MDDLTNLSSESSLEHYYNDGTEYPSYYNTLSEVWENCILESLQSIFSSLHSAIIACTIFGFATSFNLPDIYFHSLSTLCGTYLLINVIQSKRALIALLVLIILIYFTVHVIKIIQQYVNTSVFKKIRYSIEISSIVQCILITLFVLFEFFLLDKTEWLEIRGPMMIFSMKVISFFTENDLKWSPATIFQYCGYILCPGNVLFGPWITFDHYILQKNYPSKKGIFWLFGIIRALMLSMLFLTISNCLSNYFVPDFSNRWILGFKEALSFRTSHYFICYFSEALMLTAGWKDKNKHLDENYWKFSIASPMWIEFPNALATVVIHWNKPMHDFFKEYVYKKWLPFGKFYAILFTFLTSALFHGVDFKIMAILICLSLFSYVELSLRKYISSVFSICLTVYPCKRCNHSIKRNQFVCKLALFLCSLLAVFHLLFLGVLMDETTNEVGIYKKWSHYYFLSFWIAFIQFLIVV